MQPNTFLNWLTVHLAPNFTPHAIKICLEYYSISELCQLSPSELAAIPLKAETIHALKHPQQKAITEILTWAEHPNHHLLTPDCANYPLLLKEISDPPPVLYVLGDPTILANTQIAMVGSRKATAQGLALADYFSRELSAHGLTITSGLALGIDSAAHRGAKQTIAVLGTGIKRIYPRQNKNLANKILEKGAIISEFWLDTPPMKSNFPRRNRLISGLSRGTLVVEAHRRSGSLITARLALEQGRELFALPGSPFSAPNSGCNWLIQQGAKLVTSMNDILDELCLAPTAQAQCSNKLQPELDMDHRKLLECIRFDATTFEQLTEATSFSAPKLAVLLCNLKLTGYIKETFDGFSRVIQT